MGIQVNKILDILRELSKRDATVDLHGSTNLAMALRLFDIRSNSLAIDRYGGVHCYAPSGLMSLRPVYSGLRDPDYHELRAATLREPSSDFKLIESKDRMADVVASFNGTAFGARDAVLTAFFHKHSLEFAQVLACYSEGAIIGKDGVFGFQRRGFRWTIHGFEVL